MEAIVSRAQLHRTTPPAAPAQVYALAKARGMDFVTIADRDSIARVREIAHRPDVFMSVELTARFRDEAQQVRVLCLGVTAFDHTWLQRRRDDVEVCAAYLHEHRIACALTTLDGLAGAVLTARQRWRLAELFPVWEGPACDTVTEAPRSSTAQEFLGHVRAGRGHTYRAQDSGPIGQPARSAA